MAEIVDFEKFKKKKTGEEEKKEENETPAEKTRDADPDPYLTDCWRLFLILRKIFPGDSGKGHIGRVLHLTKGCKPHALMEMRELVKGYTIEELIRWLTEHPETEWNEKPALFHAIAEEVDRRIRYAASKVKK